MKMEDATRFTSKCFHGEPASCSFACPFHLDIRSFLEKAGNGRWAAAYKELRNAVVFPVIVSALCDQPCREHCQRPLIGDEAIALREIEAAAIRYAKSRKPEAYFIPPKTQSVAVIGAGVSGLSCALNLAQKKYLATVFEKEPGWGGSLRTHPQFSEFDADIALQFSAVDVNFKFETEIKALDELSGFDAIYLATGAGGESFGLRGSWEPELLTTSNPKVFMGGALCGAARMEGIAQGNALSKTIEVFLQTGKAATTHGGYDKKKCGRSLSHEGAASVPLVVASAEDGYSEEEAKQEASRCLKCDCDKCMVSCEILGNFRKVPHKMAVEVYTDSQASQTISSRTLTREAYSCNLCGHCKSVCPEAVDLGALLQFSRASRVNAGTSPPALHEFWLREMDFSGSEGSYAATTKGSSTCEYLFFPGCQLGASHPGHVLKSFAFLQDHNDAGIFLGCCGAPAYWAGDETRQNENSENIRQVWEEFGKPVFVFACATCESIFSRFLPEIKRVSLYALLSKSDGLIPARPFPEAAVFDPCAAREDHGMQEGVRTLARRAGIALEELREPNRCCGYGGHMRIANPSLYDEITQHRAEASEKPYLVYCANCWEVFTSRSKECAHILDLVFGPSKTRVVPSLQKKRDNSLFIKKTLMKQLTGADFSPKAEEWDALTLKIPPELQKSMDEALISAADLREAIWRAEDSGSRFYDESTGTYLCSLERPILTYWVQYQKPAPQTYEITGAYSHRMRVNAG